MKDAKKVSSIELSDAITEAAIAARKLKAVTDAFDREFVEKDQQENINAVTSRHDEYIHLFAVLTDELFELVQRIDSLDAMTLNME